MNEKILVIEDDLDIQEIICEFLLANGYVVEVAEDGLKGIEKFNSDKFDLILLDVMLPKIDGFVVCEIIRKTSKVPIIMLTALEEEQDQIKGFELEVDDYITKPFSVNLLIKRVEAVFRRTKAIDEEARLSFEDILIDVNCFKVSVSEKDIELTAKEFELLKIFIKNKGRILTREVLLNQLWGYDFYGDARVIDTHIKNLRCKLKIDYIKTIRGVGYKLEK
ncbi:response regulator transcription factor [Clostridium sp. UBA1056]|uniref:response regulator transcription factor n=1 Tax=unclassified Clostridium TaxID=2614128 RepID=UPI003218034C